MKSKLIDHACMMKKLKKRRHKPTLFEKIHWQVQDIYRFFKYDLPQGLEALYAYAPVIFRTKEWDSAYLFKMMAFKLKRMEPVIRHGYHVNADKTFNKMRCVRQALERLYLDDYIIKYKGKLAYKKQQQDLDIVANGLKKHSLGWWD